MLAHIDGSGAGDRVGVGEFVEPSLLIAPSKLT
jgi:hypothetical protein